MSLVANELEIWSETVHDHTGTVFTAKRPLDVGLALKSKLGSVNARIVIGGVRVAPVDCIATGGDGALAAPVDEAAGTPSAMQQHLVGAKKYWSRNFTHASKHSVR